MTSADDDVWIDMPTSDSYLDREIWRGRAPADHAPRWCGEVATLVRAATAPATADELAGEDAIVAGMQRVLREAAAAPQATAGPLLTLVAEPPAGSEAAGDERFNGVTALGAADETARIDPAEIGPTAMPGLTGMTGAADDTARIDGAETAVSDLPDVPDETVWMEGAGGLTEVGPAAEAGREGATGVTTPLGGRPVHLKRTRLELVHRPAHLKRDDPDEPEGRQGRVVQMVGRVVAVKAVAATAIALGITAAAATTGIVASVVVPKLDGDRPPAEAPVSEAPVDRSDDTPSSGGGTRPTAGPPEAAEPEATTSTTAAADAAGGTTATSEPSDDEAGDGTATGKDEASQPTGPTTTDTSAPEDPEPSTTTTVETSTTTTETTVSTTTSSPVGEGG